MILYEALVLGMQWPGGLYETSVVVGHILEYPVDSRLIAVCLHDSCLEIIRNENFWYASDMFEELSDCIYKVLCTLRGYTQHIAVVTGRQ